MDGQINGENEYEPTSIEAAVIDHGTVVAYSNIDIEDMLSGTERVYVYEYKFGYFMKDGSRMQFMGTVAGAAIFEAFSVNPKCKGKPMWLAKDYQYLLDDDGFTTDM